MDATAVKRKLTDLERQLAVCQFQPDLRLSQFEASGTEPIEGDRDFRLGALERRQIDGLVRDRR